MSSPCAPPMPPAAICTIDKQSADMIKYTAVRAVLTAATQSAPVVELADTMDLGDVTSVKDFSLHHSPCSFSGKSRFIDAGQALRSASVPRLAKTEGNKIATGSPAAHICGYGGIGRLGGFRFLCREACGFESHYPYQNGCDIYLRINIAPVFSLPIYLSIDIFSTA